MQKTTSRLKLKDNDKTKYRTRAIDKWGKPLMNLNIWTRLLKMPLKTCSETKIQPFQSRITHTIISGTKRLYNSKIKAIKYLPTLLPRRRQYYTLSDRIYQHLRLIQMVRKHKPSRNFQF